MKMPNPGQVGFNLSQYLGKMLRGGIKAIGSVGEGAPFAGTIGLNFPLAEPAWVSTVAGWLESGRNALSRLLSVGKVTPEIIDMTPVIPHGVYQTEPGDRIIMVGDLVGMNQDGEEIVRKLTSVGMIEDDSLEHVFGKAIWDLLVKIRTTNPDEYNDMIDRMFEAHWVGRLF